MIPAALILLTAATLIFGWPLLCRWSDKTVDTLVDDTLGPQVDWDAADKWWASQGGSQLR